MEQTERVGTPHLGQREKGILLRFNKSASKDTEDGNP